MINFLHFYAQPMNIVYLEMEGMYLIWLIMMLLLPKKPRLIISTICCVLSVGLILFFTIYKRSQGGELSLIPFISFTKIKEQPEILRSMQMNIFLFIPFGLSTPFALPERLRHKVLLTVPTGMVISACVEACQYFFSLGHCETDDVIMNTIGAFVGATAFLLYTAIKKLINKRRNNKWKHIRKS